MATSILTIHHSFRFGPRSRFEITEVSSSRFPGQLFFHVTDEEQEDPFTGCVALIRQADAATTIKGQLMREVLASVQ